MHTTADLKQKIDLLERHDMLKNGEANSQVYNRLRGLVADGTLTSFLQIESVHNHLDAKEFESQKEMETSLKEIVDFVA